MFYRLECSFNLKTMMIWMRILTMEMTMSQTKVMIIGCYPHQKEKQRKRRLLEPQGSLDALQEENQNLHQWKSK